MSYMSWILQLWGHLGATYRQKKVFCFWKSNCIISTPLFHLPLRKKNSSADTDTSYPFSMCLFVIISCQMMLPIHKNEFLWMRSVLQCYKQHAIETKPSEGAKCTCIYLGLQEVHISQSKHLQTLNTKKQAAWLPYLIVVRKLPCFFPLHQC